MFQLLLVQYTVVQCLHLIADVETGTKEILSRTMKKIIGKEREKALLKKYDQFNKHYTNNTK